jgi:hypothetical protein
MMPEAARERVTSPRAGAALAPASRSVSARRPHERDDSRFSVTEVATIVKLVSGPETSYRFPAFLYCSDRQFTVGENEFAWEPS